MLTQLPHQEDHTASNAFTFVVKLFNSFAYTFEVILHRNVGLRYADSNCLYSLFGLFLYVLFWPAHDLRPLVGFGCLFLFCHCVRRMQATRRRELGDQYHSFYCGDSLISPYVPLASEWQVKKVVEPLLMFTLAGFIGMWNEPLAVLVIIGSVSIFVTNAQVERRQRERVQAMHDAFLENRIAADRFRQQFGNND